MTVPETVCAYIMIFMGDLSCFVKKIAVCMQNVIKTVKRLQLKVTGPSCTGTSLHLKLPLCFWYKLKVARQNTNTVNNKSNIIIFRNPRKFYSSHQYKK